MSPRQRALYLPPLASETYSDDELSAAAAVISEPQFRSWLYTTIRAFRDHPLDPDVPQQAGVQLAAIVHMAISRERSWVDSLFDEDETQSRKAGH